MTEQASGIATIRAIWWALGVLGTAALGFLAGYMRKKGENVATREDLQDVVRQVQAVTRTTEEIKAEIAGGLWDRQKRWELRREVFFDVLKGMAEAENALLKLRSVTSVRKEMAQTEAGAVTWHTEFNKAGQRWIAAADELVRTKLLMLLIAGEDTNLTLRKFVALYNAVASEVATNESPEPFDVRQKETADARNQLILAVRRELSAQSSKL